LFPGDASASVRISSESDSSPFWIDGLVVDSSAAGCVAGIATDSSEADASAVPWTGAIVFTGAWADSLADFFASSLMTWSLLAAAVSSLSELSEADAVSVEVDADGCVVACEALASVDASAVAVG